MSELRPIGSLQIPNLKPADLTGKPMPMPMLDWLDVDDLWIDPAYQRDVGAPSLKLIARLVERWDWLKLAPILVALTERGFEVIDGQARATAAKLHPGIAKIPAYVVDGSTLPERAGAFVSHAKDRVIVTPTQIHHALVTAGDETARTLQSVCEAAGVELLSSTPDRQAYKPGQTIALAAIRRLVERQGAERARDVLAAARRTDFAPITADLVKVVEALLCDPDYAGEIDADQIVVTLTTLGSRAHAEARTLAVTKQLQMWRATVAVVFKHRRGRARTTETAPQPIAVDHVDAPARTLPAPNPVREVQSTSVAAVPKLSTRSRVIDRRPVGPVSFGDPPPGRSALDQRRAGA